MGFYVGKTNGNNKHNGGFKGCCSRCGEYGHKRADYKMDIENKPKCHYCGIYGHLEKDCRKKKYDEKNRTTKKETVALSFMAIDKKTTNKWCQDCPNYENNGDWENEKQPI